VIATALAATGMHHAEGASTASVVEWVVVSAAVVVLVWALGLAIRYTVRPEETETAHIKRRILLDEIDEPEEARQR